MLEGEYEACDDASLGESWLLNTMKRASHCCDEGHKNNLWFMKYKDDIKIAQSTQRKPHNRIFTHCNKIYALVMAYFNIAGFCDRSIAKDSIVITTDPLLIHTDTFTEVEERYIWHLSDWYNSAVDGPCSRGSLAVLRLELTTFQSVVQCLNHWATADPPYILRQRTRTSVHVPLLLA